MNKSLSLDPNYDELIVSVHQIEALLDIATSTDLTELKSETLSNYFWVIRDLLAKAKICCNSLAKLTLFSQSEDKNHAD